jgi:hypothetical protein
MSSKRLPSIVLAAVALLGCARTLVVTFGPLPNGEPLTTLIVTEDREVVGQRCRDEATLQLLGCRILRPVVLPDGVVYSLTIVRYTDALPSVMATEIEAHELCHAAAGFQAISDPCHIGNRGAVQSALPPGRLQIRIR